MQTVQKEKARVGMIVAPNKVIMCGERSKAPHTQDITTQKCWEPIQFHHIWLFAKNPPTNSDCPIIGFFPNISKTKQNTSKHVLTVGSLACC